MLQVCGGAVLRCLIEKRSDIKSESCKTEVTYFEKMEVTDYRCDLCWCRSDQDCLDAVQSKQPCLFHISCVHR